MKSSVYPHFYLVPCVLTPLLLAACGGATDDDTTGTPQVETPQVTEPENSPTPSEVTPHPAGIVLNEVVAQDVHDGPDWIEITNTSSTQVDLSRWTLQDSDGEGEPNPDHIFVIPSGQVLAPGARLVFTEGDVGSFDFGLGQDDGVFLSNAEGELVDSTTWQKGEAYGGRSWGRSPDGTGPFETLESTTAGETNAPVYVAPGDTEWLFSQDIVQQMNLEIAEEDWAWLKANAALEEYVRGVLHIGGVAYGPIGVRFKGATSLDYCVDESGALVCPKASLKLSFDEYADQDFLGLQAVALGSMYRETSMIRERLSYALQRDGDLLAPRANNVMVAVNDELQGIFLLTEVVDLVMMQDRLGDAGGVLYSEIWPVSADPAHYEGTYETSQDEPDLTGMTSFAEALAASDSSNILDILDDYMTVDGLARFIAVDRLLGTFDDFTVFYCYTEDTSSCFNHNFYLYEDSAGEFHLISWDTEATFLADYDWQSLFGAPEWYEEAPCVPTYFEGIYIYGYPSSCDPIVGGIGSQGWDQYVAQQRDVLDSIYTSDSVTERIDFIVDQIAPYVAQDPNLAVDLETWAADVEFVRYEADVQREEVEAQIASQ